MDFNIFHTRIRIRAYVFLALVYKFRKIVGRNVFSDQFRKMSIHYKRIGYNMNVMRLTACLVVNPITININAFAALFNCMPAGRA